MYPEDAWSNLKLGLRLGPLPRIMCTTTPRPKQFIKQVMKEADVLVTGSLYENKDNLPESFIRDLMKLEGSRLARQEIYGEVIEIEEMGIIKRSDWRLWPHDKPLPRFQFIVMSIDAATTEKDRDSKTHDPDFSACSVWGMFEHLNKRRFMLLDFWQERMGLPDLIAKVKKERQVTYGDIDVPAFKPAAFAPLIKFNNFGRRIDLILIEQQGGGRQLVQMLGTEGILCHEYNPGRLDKLQRLHMVSPAFAQGLVYAVESETILGRPKLWTEEIVSQMCSYAGKGSLPHDDALDCGVGALRYLIDNHLGPMTVEIRPDGRRADEGVEFVPPALEGNPYSE
jgi:phage terminase large subunit-like protein